MAVNRRLWDGGCRIMKRQARKLPVHAADLVLVAWDRPDTVDAPFYDSCWSRGMMSVLPLSLLLSLLVAGSLWLLWCRLLRRAWGCCEWAGPSVSFCCSPLLSWSVMLCPDKPRFFTPSFAASIAPITRYRIKCSIIYGACVLKYSPANALLGKLSMQYMRTAKLIHFV